MVGRPAARSHLRLWRWKYEAAGYVAVAVRKQLRPEEEPASSPQVLLREPASAIQPPCAEGSKTVPAIGNQVYKHMTVEGHFASDITTADPPEPHLALSSVGIA